MTESTLQETQGNYLRAEITNLLQEAGHPNPGQWESMLPLAPAFGDPMSMKIEINRFWRIQLLSLPIDTSAQRFCMVDQCDDKDFLELYKNHIVPCILKNNLPVTI